MKKGLKFALLGVALMLGGACFTLAYSSTSTRAYDNVVMVRAEDGETTEVVETTEEEKETSAIKEAIEHWKDTYLVPLLSGVSITSVASVGITLVLTIIREKRFSARDKDLKDRSAKSEALIAEANQKIAEANATLAMVKEVFEAIKKTVMENEELRKLLSDKFKEIEKMLSQNNTEIAKLNKIEPILKILIKLEAKVAMLSKEAVASGIAEDVNELVRLAKEF